MSKCRSCGAEIIWIETEEGKKHPVDAKPEKRWVESFYYDAKREMLVKEWKLADTYITHFATCPQSKKWSRKNGHM